MAGLRHALASEIARWFYHHLEAELAKGAPLQDQVSFDGRSSGEVNREIRGRLLREFPGIEITAKPPFNLIREWARRNRFAFRYEDYNFERYNRLFIERLIALRDNTPESLQRFKEARES